MHTVLESAFAYVAQNVPGLIVKVDEAVFQGSSSRMDLVRRNPLTGGLQTLYVGVMMGTAMGNREYAGTLRNGARLEPGWRSVRMGSAVRRAQDYKQVKYAWRVQQGGGRATFEGPVSRTTGASGRALVRCSTSSLRQLSVSCRLRSRISSCGEGRNTSQCRQVTRSSWRPTTPTTCT